MSNEPESIQAVATRVRRQTRNADILRLCDHALAPSSAASAPAPSPAEGEGGVIATPTPKFSKTAYQREYMRKRRAKDRSARD